MNELWTYSLNKWFFLGSAEQIIYKMYTYQNATNNFIAICNPDSKAWIPTGYVRENEFLATEEDYIVPYGSYSLLLYKKDLT